MMKKRKRKTIGILIVVLTIFSLTYIVIAASSEPGSTDDPIVTQSYVEMRNEQLKYYVDESIKKIQESISKISGGSQDSNSVSASFQVVNVPAGKKLICGASTEIILRAGKAIAIDSPLGGIANVTVGKDLKKDDVITANHLLIIPRDDGRGANALTESIFMVKGVYRIE